MSRKCYIDKIREDILDAYGVNKTSASLLKPNKILLPVGGIDGANEQLVTKENTLQWAKRVADQLYAKYNSKLFGNVVAIDNTKENGTIVDITIPTRLIDAYERKYGTQTEMYSLNTNKVNYQLKAIKALESDKVRQPKKSTIQGFYNDLVKQGITNQQLNIVKDIYKDGSTKEDLITSLLAEMSFTVEINTAKEKLTGKIAAEEGMYVKEENGKYYLVDAAYSTKNEISKQEYKDFNNNKQIPTKHYSNLTVPGGTNYTENEIKTPDITPSIKGHAQFSTDNGIGWFRSDEQVTGGQVYQQEEDDYGPAILETYDGTPTKTRRILEVQSDLFQKGREHKVIAKTEDSDYGDDTFYPDNKGNQFLQLLNKDNNWVTFFVKSIIQSTAKQTVTEIQQEDVEAKVRDLEKEGLLEIDCSGKLGFTKGGTWTIKK